MGLGAYRSPGVSVPALSAADSGGENTGSGDGVVW